MRTSRVAYGFLTSFIVTIFLLNGWQTTQYPRAVWMLLSVAAVIATGLALRRKPMGNILIATTLGTALAFIAVARTTHVTGNGDIETFANGTFSIVRGHIADAPDRRPLVTKYLVETEQITQGTVTNAAQGRILAGDRGGWPRYDYGDAITIKGKLLLPERIEEFDYPAYLRLKGIEAIMPDAKLSVSDGRPLQGFTYTLQGTLITVRDRFEAQINSVLPEPHASLLAGLLTGSRRGLPKQLTDAFRIAGLSHIVAISGFNITIILSLLGGLLFWLPIRARFPLLTIGLILFTLFVGAGPPVVRAAIMGILGLLALASGRRTTLRLSILWTACIMLLWKPAFLWDDASFQLTFLAVIGITELSPLLQRLLRHVPETLALRESLVATIAAQIATIPLTVVLFGQLSLIAPLSNILVAPIIPIAMLLGFIGTVLSFVWMPLGLVVSYLAWACLQAIVFIAQTAASLPFAAITF